MIHVHLGCVKPRPGDEVLIGSPADYASARRAIRDALRRESTDLDVYVLTRVCDDWFWDLESLPGLVELQHDDPATVLCSLLGLSALPAVLDDAELILYLDLLTLPSPKGRVSDPIGWALGARIGAVWEEQESSPEHFTRLVTWWAENPVPEAIVQPLLERRWEGWVAGVSGALAEAYTMLRERPVQMAQFLCSWKALDTYSIDQRKRWLQEERWYRDDWHQAAEKSGTLPLPPKIERVLSAKVEAYWNGFFMEHREQGAL